MSKLKPMAIEDVTKGFYLADWGNYNLGMLDLIYIDDAIVFYAGGSYKRSDAMRHLTFYSRLNIETCAAIHSGDSVVVDRKLLEKLEWCSTDYDQDQGGQCHICGAREWGGHYVDCKLSDILTESTVSTGSAEDGKGE